ncbi:GGDEF domain-containing protein [Roseateles sp. GG27B]
MNDDPTPPEWLPVLNRWVQKLGAQRSLLLLCATVWLLAMAISQLMISLLGHGDRQLMMVTASVCALLITGVIGWLFLNLIVHLEQSQHRTQRFATRDLMTGVFTRRHFLSLVDREWAAAQRYGMACAMLVFDVDHFKRVNDGFGQRCGDLLLRRIALASSETLRQADVLARFDSETFILFLPHTDPLGAVDVGERIRERIDTLNFCWNSQALPVSVSVGVAALQDHHLTLDQMIHDAEDALHLAKLAGRNCVRAGAGLLSGKPGNSGNSGKPGGVFSN